ncbi:MAG: AAA family ATPase, partial [Bacteroidales bacterium]|nr:AAA family ATPase [Bacteroidales bacterium]
MNLKIEHKQDLKQEEVDLINEVKQAGNHPVKVSTNKLSPEYDKKDSRDIKALRNLKIIYKLVDKGCLILKGVLECEFKDDFRGKFYVVQAIKDEGVNFDSIKGLETEINFSQPNYAITNNELMSVLKQWSEDPDLVYNIEQFDEFMELFEFYKELSSERNNETSYKIKNISEPYYFISIDDAETELKDMGNKEVFDHSGIIVGYKLRSEVYDQLSNSIKDKVRKLVDIEIIGGGKVINRINSIGFDCVYLSNHKTITENEVLQLTQFQVVSINNNDGKLKLSGEVKNPKRDYKFLNLYDMGQKIKVESIDNSLRLINQGASGAASELLRYLIGDDDMPNNKHESDGIKEIYMHGLNESQRKAFLMAIDGSPVSLIKGPPGTGKTHVINAIVQYIVKELREKVIISSQTHIAIDNVLDKLMSNYDPIIPTRITNRKNKYSSTDIDVTLYKTWGVNFEEHNKLAKNTNLATKVKISMNKFQGKKQFSYSKETDMSEFSVIGATTTTSAISGKKGLKVLEGFKWLIIDEVSKCPITEVLRYLPYVEKIILVGDDFQLAPLLEFKEDDVKDFKSFDKDKFEKLCAMYESSVFEKTLHKAEKCNRVVLLNENYRSKEKVLAIYNVFYDNK